MAFHLTNLGSFSVNLQRFADRNGYVPEDDDRPTTMDGTLDYGSDFDEDAWAEFLQEAVEATTKAVAALVEWRADGDGRKGEFGVEDYAAEEREREERMDREDRLAWDD